MTIPTERTRALVWAGGFLIELARNESLPLSVRQDAVAIARHFPTIEQLSIMASQLPRDFGVGLSDPGDSPEMLVSLPLGPLRYTTRLEWPEGES